MVDKINDAIVKFWIAVIALCMTTFLISGIVNFVAPV